MPQHLSKPVVRSSPRTLTRRPNNKKPSTYSRMTSNSVADHFNNSVLKKKSGVSDSKLFLPFLEGARKLVDFLFVLVFVRVKLLVNVLRTNTGFSFCFLID